MLLMWTEQIEPPVPAEQAAEKYERKLAHENQIDLFIDVVEDCANLGDPGNSSKY